MTTPATPAPPRRTGWVRPFPALTVMLLAGPVLAGLAGVVLPAFGWLPALGGDSLSLDPWRRLADWPGLSAAVRLSVATGVAATALSLAITLLIVAALQGTRAFTLITRMLAPLLSLPHAAAAFGLAFLIAPSGWIARALSPWATGWERPPDLLIVGDPAGLTLIAGLVIKEVPFLMLMTLAAMGQSNSAHRMLVAQSLGYGRLAGWMIVVLPSIYAQIRLPVYAVLAYSMSVVDVALILGPTRPPTLAVQIVTWMNHPDLTHRFVAAAGAVLQLALVAAALLAWRLGENMVGLLGRHQAQRGARARALDQMARPVAIGLAAITAGAVLLGIAGLALWSVSGLWQFPDPWPSGVSLRHWQSQARGLGDAMRVTTVVGVVSTAIALVLAVGCLEREFRAGAALRPAPGFAALVYLPLIVPQVAFLPGLTTLALLTGLDGTLSAVTLTHVVFVLPYVFLALADPWRAWDARCAIVAHSLGATRTRVLWSIRLPMLLRAMAIAAAIGFATSVAQYLPTLLLGAGRVVTLTTEAVALAAGGNRRLIGVWALMQMILPFAGFALALALPAVAFARRKGMQP